jgi:glyoxylase-like metal-dependent hydrolase (beta-lactamase superfamily II)
MTTEMNRRSFLHMGMSAAAAAVAPRWMNPQNSGGRAPVSPVDLIAQMRASGDSTEIKATKLYDNMYFLQGAGGNMALQTGPDGKILIDSSFSTAVPRLRKALSALSDDSPHLLINTHWHFDHTEGNEGMHAAGFTILAHSMTRERLSRPSEIKIIGASFPAASVAALPTVTFEDKMHLWHNGDTVAITHFSPAHTDTDVYIHFQKANVVHMGDVWENGFYPGIDESSGGNINGLIRATEKALALTGPDTKIIPGHGPLGTKAQLQATCDMLSTVRERVAKLKATGASEQEVVARKPTADLDATWANGPFPSDMFVGVVYRTL